MNSISFRYRSLGICLFVGLLASGCTKMAATTTAAMMMEMKPSMNSFWDYEIAGPAIAVSLLQLEGLQVIDPDNDDVTVSLIEGYVTYALAYVEDEAEVAEMDGNIDKMKRDTQRAAHLYERAKRLAFTLLRKRDPDIDDAITTNEQDLAEYLRDYYTNTDDAHLLFWTATSWIAYMRMSGELDSLIDLWAVRVMGERILEIDPQYEKGAADALLGAYECAIPRSFGGDAAKCKKYFESALKKSQRQNHMFHIMYALGYAIEMQDRKLFISLMHEILRAKDVGDDFRLNNKVARHRAERYLTKRSLDSMFPVYR